jgi:hypothetical protein
VESFDSFIVERRGRPRLAVISPARLRPNDWSTAQVDMLDISEDGFRAAGELLFRIGAYVSLQVPGIGWLDALIVWTHPGQFGARFLVPIDLAHCGWTAERAGKGSAPAALGRQLASRVLLDDQRPELG